MPSFDRQVAYENERRWEEPGYYPVREPWFVQAMEDSVDVARVDFDNPPSLLRLSPDPSTARLSEKNAKVHRHRNPKPSMHNAISKSGVAHWISLISSLVDIHIAAIRTSTTAVPARHNPDPRLRTARRGLLADGRGGVN